MPFQVRCFTCWARPVPQVGCPAPSAQTSRPPSHALRHLALSCTAPSRHPQEVSICLSSLTRRETRCRQAGTRPRSSDTGICGGRGRRAGGRPARGAWRPQARQPGRSRFVLRPGDPLGTPSEHPGLGRLATGQRPASASAAEGPARGADGVAGNGARGQRCPRSSLAVTGQSVDQACPVGPTSLVWLSEPRPQFSF